MKILKKFGMALLVSVFLLIAAFYGKRYYENNYDSIENILPLKHTIPRVAHAGGGIGISTYTNSLDALNANKDKFSIFEIDLNLTADNKVVCIHDWNQSATSAFGVDFKTPPTFSEFTGLVKNSKHWKNCTLETLVDWLEKNDNKLVVTDIKTNKDFEKIIETISRVHAKNIDRFIVQIYKPEQYETVKNYGFTKIIMTLYKWHATDRKVIDFAEVHDLFAVTMPYSRACNLASKLSQRGIPTYAHTINEEIDFSKARSCGVTEIYTDYLSG